MRRFSEVAFLSTWQSRVPLGLNILGVVLLLGQALLWWWQPSFGSADAPATSRETQEPYEFQVTREAVAPRGVSVKAQPGKIVRLPRYKGTPSPVLGRVVDRDAKLAYAELGGLWERGKPRPKDDDEAEFTRHQQFVSEKYDGGTWMGSLGSGRLPSQLHGSFSGPDRLFKATLAFQDHRTATSWPEGTVTRDVASQPVKVRGRPAWVIARELDFTGLKPGLRTGTELAVAVMVDVDGYRPSFVFLSLPDSHRALRPDVNRVVSSIRVLP
ncbi:hypothetical protein ACFVH6_00870 [Spirillospora sp. NPDC127200]